MSLLRYLKKPQTLWISAHRIVITEITKNWKNVFPKPDAITELPVKKFTLTPLKSILLHSLI